jgi:hypothetical protein
MLSARQYFLVNHFIRQFCCWIKIVLLLADTGYSQTFQDFAEHFTLQTLPFSIEGTYVDSSVNDFSDELEITPFSKRIHAYKLDYKEVEEYLKPQQDDIQTKEWYAVARFETNPNYIILIARAVVTDNYYNQIFYYLYTFSKEGKKLGVIDFASETFKKRFISGRQIDTVPEIFTGKIKEDFDLLIDYRNDHIADRYFRILPDGRIYRSRY